ncbi:MAG: hypothetical protein SFU99_01605 [Saprospiraceae bacterium]|nr:hypothetical protein [Saprospiraceae bacterium]
MRIKIFILFLFTLFSFLNNLYSQNITTEKAIWAVDYIKAKEGQLPDLLQFFELNWKGARKYAKKHKYVEDYQWYVLPYNTDYQVVLMTKYKDQAQYDQREENFQKIFAKYKPKPILVNGKGSRDMSEIVKSEEFYEPKF